MLKSHRDIPLVMNKPCSMGALLTVEVTEKWYEIYVVFPDGRVQKVPYELFWKGLGTGWHDHVPNPYACLAVSKELNIEWDATSYQLIVGRYMMEVREDVWKKLLDEDANNVNRPTK